MVGKFVAVEEGDCLVSGLQSWSTINKKKLGITWTSLEDAKEISSRKLMYERRSLIFILYT